MVESIAPTFSYDKGNSIGIPDSPIYAAERRRLEQADGHANGRYALAGGRIGWLIVST
jgi:hypothetical protein